MSSKQYRNKLISDYEQVCNELVVLFANKQGLRFEGWVANEVGSIADFNNEYYFTISEMVLDIRTNQPKGLITSWQDDNVANEHNIINYHSYTAGLRHKDIINK